jgi:hypothetical protein
MGSPSAGFEADFISISWWGKRKFSLIGRGLPGLAARHKVEQIIYICADTPYKTIDDVRKAVVPPKCGATGTSSTGYGTADVAIIAARNRLLKLVREFQNGIDPYAAYHGDLYNIRPLDVVAEEDDLLKLVSQYEDHIRVRL